MLHTQHGTTRDLPSDTHLTSAWKGLSLHSCPGNLPHKNTLVLTYTDHSSCRLLNTSSTGAPPLLAS